MIEKKKSLRRIIELQSEDNYTKTERKRRRILQWKICWRIRKNNENWMKNENIQHMKMNDFLLLLFIFSSFLWTWMKWMKTNENEWTWMETRRRNWNSRRMEHCAITETLTASSERSFSSLLDSAENGPFKLKCW